MIPSRRLDPTRVYDHRHHAGNIGDVFKHAVLFGVIDALANTGAPLCWVDTHAAFGWYKIAQPSEADEGVQRLVGVTGAPRSVERLLAAVRVSQQGRVFGYPGSPTIVAAALRTGDRAVFCDVGQAEVESLGRLFGDRTDVECVHGDGLAEAERRARLCGAGAHAPRLVCLVDPPYAAREEWTQLPGFCARVLAAAPGAVIAVWYPVKGLSRPAALRAELKRARVDATTIELVTAPLDERRNRLNGSGMVLIGAPLAAVESASAVGTWLGLHAALRAGQWSLRVVAGAESSVS